MMQLPLIADDLVFICRMCEHMAEQMERGTNVCQLRCGGPRKGLAFPLYKGPMDALYIRDHCYSCGLPAEMRIAVGGNPDLGICKKHLERLVGKDKEPRLNGNGG